jgi:hypothetical protein
MAIQAIELVNTDGSGRTRLVDSYTIQGDDGVSARSVVRRFTPNGRSVIYLRIDPKSHDLSLWSIGVDGKNPTCVVPIGDNESVGSFCISPDGKHLAVVFVSELPDADIQLGRRAWELFVLDIDGKNRRPFPVILRQFDLLDWRPSGP